MRSSHSPVLCMLRRSLAAVCVLVGAKDGRQAAGGFLLQQHLLHRRQRVHAMHHIVPCPHVDGALDLLLFTHHLAAGTREQ